MPVTTHADILTAAAARLTALALADGAASPTALPVVQRFSFTPDWARSVGKPCIAYGPAGILTPVGATNQRFDTGYPLTIRLIAEADKETPTNGNLYLSHMHDIRKAFQDKALGTSLAHTCTLIPGPLIEQDAAALNILSLALTFVVVVRESRS